MCVPTSNIYFLFRNFHFLIKQCFNSTDTYNNSNIYYKNDFYDLEMTCNNLSAVNKTENGQYKSVSQCFGKLSRGTENTKSVGKSFSRSG